MKGVHHREDTSDGPQDNAGDGHSFAPAFHAALGKLSQTNGAKHNRKNRWNHRARRWDADDPKHQRRHAEPIARAAGLQGGAFHREGHAASLAIVGADRAERRAARTLDRLIAIALSQNLWGALAGRGVSMDRMWVLLDDLSGLWVDQSAVAIEDRNGDVVAAGGALAILGGHRLGCLQT